jgi:hypothetical protein
MADSFLTDLEDTIHQAFSATESLFDTVGQANPVWQPFLTDLTHQLTAVETFVDNWLELSLQSFASGGSPPASESAIAGSAGAPQAFSGLFFQAPASPAGPDPFVNIASFSEGNFFGTPK